jgi:hypothetical protein
MDKTPHETQYEISAHGAHDDLGGDLLLPRDE